MFFLIIMFLIILLISFIISIINFIISTKMKLNMEKMSPFECGFNPLIFNRMPLSINFFLITIFFLIFDIEISLILPMIFSFNLSNYMIWLFTSMMIIMILILGIKYEWKMGALKWL